jgi:enterochelin esterase family protein
MNYLRKPNLVWQSNMVLVPGDPAEPWEVQHVPHGALHHHFYRSEVIGDERDYFVYTPPGYTAHGHDRYPVLYLLHGYSDTAEGWTAVGQANMIMDNLLATGRVKPMLIVMPLGYGVPGFASHTSSNFRDADLNARNFKDFRTALLDEVLPQVEHEYRVESGRTHRAIAGLSMGGAESLYVGLNNVDKFAYVGAFSSGGLPGTAASAFPGLTGAKVNSRLQLLWISCGKEDGLITFNRELIKSLRAKGVQLTPVETEGRHEWPVWRRNLISFASQLFK